MAPAEHWDVTPGNNVPQLAVVYREDLGKGKRGRSTYTLYILHYNSSSSPRTSGLPAYTKGSHQATYICSDNSRFIVYGKDKEQAQIMINAATAHIKPDKLSLVPVRFGEIRGEEFKEARVIPVRAQYFSQGKKQKYPDWTVYF